MTMVMQFIQRRTIDRIISSSEREKSRSM
jgi:hypothetical protein